MELSALSEFIIRIRIRILGADFFFFEILGQPLSGKYNSKLVVGNLNRRSGRPVCVIPKYLSSTVCHNIKFKCPQYRVDSHQS
jgi:hypothetical protein